MPVDTSLEEELYTQFGSVACLDEVGRGALAGPVCVGAVLVTAECGPAPSGLADSKKLTARRREAALPSIQAWVQSYSVGSASPREIDDVGIVPALQMAAVRAIHALSTRPGVILLDGPHDYISFDGWDVPVRTKVKADASCAGVAAAAIIAKQYRDALMVELAKLHPEYAWNKNMGYGAAAHREALSANGVTDQHRKTWRLGT